jgi:hypothetical protein
MIGFVVHCPSQIRSYADQFKDLLSTADYQSFVAVLCAAIFGTAGYCDVFRFFLFSPSVSSLWRFFNEDGLVEKLNRRHRRIIRRLLPVMQQDPGRFLWVIDDTLTERSGRGEKTWGAYWWHDHTTNGKIFGHRVLTLGVVDRKRQILIPIAWEILHRKDVSSESDDYQKAWERSLDLLDIACSEGFPKFTVVADSWFSGDEFFARLTDRGYDFVSEVRCNRKVARCNRQSFDMRVDVFFATRWRSNVYFHSKCKWAAESNIIFNDASVRLKTVAVANKKNLAEQAFGYYVSNKLTWNASKIWGIWRDRWAIEVQFRELKQFFTLGEAAVWNESAVRMSIALSMIALTVIRLEQCARVGANEDQYVRPCAAGDIVRQFMLESFAQGQTKLAHEHLGKPLRMRIAQRINPKNLKIKPAEVRKGRKTYEGEAMQKRAA